MTLRILMTIFTALLLVSATAAEYRHGALRLSHLHTRATAPGQSSAAVYLTITNSGPAADRLLAVETTAAASAALHTMSMQDSVMKMRELNGLAVAPATTVAMVAGHGAHIMLTGLRRPLVAGQTIPLLLKFEKAGAVKTVVTIDALTSMP